MSMDMTRQDNDLQQMVNPSTAILLAGTCTHTWRPNCSAVAVLPVLVYHSWIHIGHTNSRHRIMHQRQVLKTKNMSGAKMQNTRIENSDQM